MIALPAAAAALVHVLIRAPRGGASPLRRASSFVLVLLGLALAAVALRAQDVLPVPPLSGRVIDRTATLQPAQIAALEAKLAGFEAQSGPQIVVLIVPTTAPEDIAAFAHRVADTWKIGRREVGDGVLVVVAKDDRRVRIEVAKALEGAVPDLAARQIIDRHLREAFRAGDYAGGLNAAIDALMARIRGEGLPAPAAARSSGERGWQLDDLGLFFFVAVPVLGTLLTRMLGRRGGSLLTAGGTAALAWWLTASMLLAALAGIGALLVVGLFGIGAAARRGAHRGSFGGWGGFGGGTFGGGDLGGGGFGDGGGFSSGGGGDFGGGGASGDW